jgi:uncharacterized protein (DUF58 family)
VLLAALTAPIALLLATLRPGAWIFAPALGAGLLALVLADALLAPRLAGLRLIAPQEVEVGAEAPLTLLADFARAGAGKVEARLALDPRLVPGGTLGFSLAPDPASGVLTGHATITPPLRGVGEIGAVWLRWAGPLGLGARQHRRALAQAIRVVPNIAPVRSPALRSFLRDAEAGLVARRFSGDGTQFEALSDYQPGMDRRRIDWKASARHAQLYARDYEAERNNQLVFALDCGRAMCEPVAGLARLDRAITAALTTAFVALKGGDRVALFGFAARVRLATPFMASPRDFHRLQSAAATLDYEPREPNFTLALATLAARLQRRSLVVVFSDFTDPTSAELMVESIGRLVARHRVIFVTLADAELEGIAAAAPQGTQALAMAVTADALLRQRALAAERLRQIGVDVIEAPHRLIGTRLIDSYLAIRQRGGIG